MASVYEFKCNKCSYKVKTSGPHEFELEKGKIITSIHPSCGIKYPYRGLYLNIFCTKCNKNARLIIVRFSKPVKNPWRVHKSKIEKKYLSNYSHFFKFFPKKKFISTEIYNYNAVKCPICSSLLLKDKKDFEAKDKKIRKGVVMFKPYSDVEYSCPKCKKGKLIGGLIAMT